MKILVSALLLLGLSAVADDSVVVTLTTSLGNFDVQLNSDKAPVSVKNFLSYVDSGFYNGTIFHRVVKGFVIQGGGLTPDMQEKPTQDPITNEAGNGLSNLKGTIGMARTDDVNSATSQFYVNTADNLNLDHKDNTPENFGYAVFGQVINGYDVVEKIENVSVHNAGDYDDVPDQTILITAINRTQGAAQICAPAQ